MEKKGLKRWFILEDTILKWYEESPSITGNTKPKGHLYLVGCTVNEVSKVTYIISLVKINKHN